MLCAGPLEAYVQVGPCIWFRYWVADWIVYWLL